MTDTMFSLSLSLFGRHSPFSSFLIFLISAPILISSLLLILSCLRSFLKDGFFDARLGDIPVIVNFSSPEAEVELRNVAKSGNCV